MFESSIQTIEQLKNLLLQLPQECYSQPCKSLSNASIGQHTRHVIELYQCLLKGHLTEDVCYDKRKRDQQTEQNLDYAISQLTVIQKNIEKPDKTLFISHELNGETTQIKSNYKREVLYNLEHLIHHQALIKVGVIQLTNISLCETFGVAPSTIQHKNNVHS